MAKAADKRNEQKRRVVTAERRTAEHSSGNNPSIIIPAGLSMWLPKKAGAYTIDIIPFEVGPAAKRFSKNYANVGDLYYERTYFTHGRIGANADSYVCSAASFGRPCAICEWRNAMFKSARKEDQELAKNQKPSERQLFLIWDHEAKQKGVQLWAVSNYAFGKQLDSKINNASPKKKPAYMRFADPEDGLTLRLIAEEKAAGSGKFMNFTVDEFQERDEPLPDEIVNHNFCLDNIPAEIAYEKLKKIFFMTPDEEEPAEEDTIPEPEPEEPTPPSSRRSTTAPVEEEPQTEEETPEEQPEEEQTEEVQGATDESNQEPASEIEWKKGMDAQFDYRDEILQGSIIRIDTDKGLAFIDVEGRDRPVTVDLSDLKPIEESAETEPEPEPVKPAPKPVPKVPAKPAAPAAAKPAAPAKPAPFKPAAPAKPAAAPPAKAPAKPAAAPAKKAAGGWDD